MSDVQMAHLLKQVVNSNELAGIDAVFRAGWVVGVYQTLLAGVVVYGVCRLGRWGYEKVRDCLQGKRLHCSLRRSGLRWVKCQDISRCRV